MAIVDVATMVGMVDLIVVVTFTVAGLVGIVVVVGVIVVVGPVVGVGCVVGCVLVDSHHFPGSVAYSGIAMSAPLRPETAKQRNFN